MAYEIIKKFGVLPRNSYTFGHHLQNAGYATCIAGKWQLGREADSPQHFGFEEALLWQHKKPRTRNGDNRKGPDSRYENPILEHNGQIFPIEQGTYGPQVLTDFIKEFITQNKNEPFFVYYPMLLPHCPFVATPDSPTWDPNSQGSTSYVGDPAYFGDMVAYMDKLVGDIVQHVDDLQLRDDTIIIFTGDNGTDRTVTSQWNGRTIQGGKKKMTDNGTRVPLIVSAPGRVKPQVIDNLVDLSDFFPTLAALAETPVTAPNRGFTASFDKSQPIMDGVSFTPQLFGHPSNQREWIYLWYNPSNKPGKTKIFARNQTYKLYQGGKFFNVTNDPNEKKSLSQQKLSADQKETYRLLQQVIDDYQSLAK